ncbi:MAG: hypothetical protein HXX09_01925 [Bacteroidetes bacterium]|nr:hypothetical protein [Bacteroidota bacterium]
MKRADNNHIYKKFRTTYETFVYECYTINKNEAEVVLNFQFNLSNLYYFNPEIRIPKKSFFVNDNMSDDLLNNIVFNIGMIELVSYWKTACPKKVIIKPFSLSKSQIDFWKKIYFNGLGEFFYLNSIEADINNFMEIEVDSDKKFTKVNINNSSSTIIPIGGGKDSIVTLELLRKFSENNLCLIMNPRGATVKTIETAGYSMNDVFEIHRKIDPLLLELNSQGFLNGHTPFSALLAFVTVLAALLTNRKHIALSNENSANESTVADTNINHQYSKSFEFENDFRNYVSENISESFNYFSFLRPLDEIQIAKLFSKFPKYHKVFRSCNAGSKTDVWCGNCPKCMFVYIILSPFLEKEKMIEIFGKNLLEDKNLTLYFDQLTGIEKVKPFECIGTVDEVNWSLNKIIEKQKDSELPYLLKHYVSNHNFQNIKLKFDENLINHFNSEHFLIPEFEAILTEKLHEDIIK